MGWPFSGTWEGVSIQGLGEIIPALIRGLNERREAIGLTAVAFATSGSDMEYPTAADYDGFSLDAPLSDLLAAIWDAVVTLSDGNGPFVKWYTDDTFTTELDSDNLEDYVGSAPSDIKTDLRRVMRIREALEVMVYYGVYKTVQETALTDMDYAYVQEAEASFNDTWDLIKSSPIAYSDLGPSDFLGFNAYSGSGTEGIREWGAVKRTDGDLLDLTAFSGVCVAARFSPTPYTFGIQETVLFTFDVQVTTDLATDTVSSSGQEPGADFDLSPSLFEMGEAHTIECRVVRPASKPVPFDFESVTHYNSMMFDLNFFIFADLSTILTDQT